MRVLVLGALGQDGRLLCEHLRSRDHAVLGFDRHASAERDVMACNVADFDALAGLLRDSAPDAVFHLAALHGHTGTAYENLWREMLAVNVGSLHVVLEHARNFNRDLRVIYASSVKVYGETLPRQINDATPMRPTGLYGITKQAATEAIGYYRRTHGLRASAIHLSNHESWFRPANFFIPKLVSALAGAIKDGGQTGEVLTMDFCCDWGSAEEYMALAATLMERNLLCTDYVMARGTSVYARDLAQTLFQHFNLEVAGHLHEKIPGELEKYAPYTIDCTNLREYLGITPQRDILEVCYQILARNHGISHESVG
jgi:GDPmannose 4,6-dehydratase